MKRKTVFDFVCLLKPDWVIYFHKINGLFCF